VSIPKGPLVTALTAEWTAIDALLAALPPGDWTRPTRLPGWRVTDVVAHLIGTESALAGDETPTGPEAGPDVRALPHVRNDVAAFNEQWVQALRDATPAEMLARYRAVTGRRTAQLAKLTQADFDAPSWTPAGQDTYARFMQIRDFDCWMHEQDLRAALGRPGHEDGPSAEVALDEAARALGYLVGKRAAAPEGSVVRIELTGPVTRCLSVAVTDRARLVEEEPTAPTAVLRMPSSLYMRLGGGRTRDHDGVELSGDLPLARRVLDNLAFTI
jgi:uncharacterized protein (TIGR03083 family)